MIPERKDNPLVICGFPGIGKSMFASYMKENEHRDDILDLDSKPFKAKDVNHPDRYCKEIEKAYLSKKSLRKENQQRKNCSEEQRN